MIKQAKALPIQETVLHATISEDEFAAWVDDVRLNPEGNLKKMVALLARRHPIYQNRSLGVVNRMRGYVLASFEQTGLPNQALPYVLEALDSSFHSYVVAAAAKALRGMPVPLSKTAPYLIKAIFNIWRTDQPISFETYRVKWPLKTFSTALIEIFDTLSQMGAYADQVLPDLERLYNELGHHLSKQNQLKLSETIEAIRQDDQEVAIDGCDCDLPIVLEQPLEPNATNAIDEVLIEDQSGVTTTWNHFFQGSYTILVFFYTRCTNPRRCTLTIHNLVEIQRTLEQEGLLGTVKTAAISYDPVYDTSATLKSYGDARNFQFGENHRMFRVPQAFHQVIQTFELGVNFTGSLVNQHQIELFVMDAQGQVVASQVRFQAEPKQVVEKIKNLLKGETSSSLTKKPDAYKKKVKSHLNNTLSIILPFLVAFFPKCLACWASYLSVFGLTSLASLTYQPWLLPVMVLMLGFNLVILYRKAKNRNGRYPFIFSCVGTALLLAIGFSDGALKWLLIPGISLLVIGSMLNSLSYYHFNKLRLFMLNLRYFRMS